MSALAQGPCSAWVGLVALRAKDVVALGGRYTAGVDVDQRLGNSRVEMQRYSAWELEPVAEEPVHGDRAGRTGSPGIDRPGLCAYESYPEHPIDQQVPEAHMARLAYHQERHLRDHQTERRTRMRQARQSVRLTAQLRCYRHNTLQYVLHRRRRVLPVNAQLTREDMSRRR